ncbi:class I SAM-dependent methyltransferase [Paenibacillus sp. MBLB4367]|uniref:class I SAM-dependent methyltransferase n=1 Tax=Paenibacillus sp. MBLB4367 TaxID=3384767 RepID=UPI0039080139
MNKKLQKIRTAERQYHEAFYENNGLFEAGSWLNKPVKAVTDTLQRFREYDEVRMLDLGCGIGRNSIPMAQALIGRTGSVVCVDLLESALSKLEENSRRYAVSEYIVPRLSDITHVEIGDREYDFIVAVSSLEHAASEEGFCNLLARMADGKKPRGVNCLIINTNMQEIDRETGEELEHLTEVLLSTEQTEHYLSEAYSGWEILLRNVKQLEFPIDRGERKVIWKTDCLTFVAHKTGTAKNSSRDYW